MKKYWIIVDGKPVGPFSPSELKVRRDFTASLPVWCAELPDWTTAGAIEELASLLPSVEQPAEEAPEPEKPCPPEIPLRDNRPQPEPRSSWIPRGAYVAAVQAAGEKRPSTFIGWNIAMLFCCCLPAGIVGLIFGSQVNSRWERGDIDGARKASAIAEWCVILSIVLGLVSWPFQLLFM